MAKPGPQSGSRGRRRLQARNGDATAAARGPGSRSGRAAAAEVRDQDELERVGADLDDNSGPDGTVIVDVGGIAITEVQVFTAPHGVQDAWRQRQPTTQVWIRVDPSARRVHLAGVF